MSGKKNRRRLSPEEIASRVTSQHAENQLTVPHPQTVPADAGIESPTGASPAQPLTRVGEDTRPARAVNRGGTPQLAEPAVSAVPAVPPAVPAAEPAAAVDPAATRAPEPAPFVFITDDGNVDAETRRGRLAHMQPEGPTRDVAAVKDTVISLVEAVPYKGYESDRSLLTIGVAFGRWCLHNTADGTFDPARDLREDSFEDFLTFEKSEVTPQTRSTYVSQLRRIARGGQPRRKGIRKPAAQPYNAKSRDRFWRQACDMQYWGAAEMRTLLALTFGAGCRGAEVHTMTAGQVERVNGRVVVSIVKNRMWVRDVPVYGHYGRWLDQRARELEPDQWLFRPTFGARRNATADLIARMRRRDPVFTGFKSTRARHSWFVACLQAGIPFHAVCQAIALGRDSNLPTEMLPYMPHLTSTETRRHFEAAFARSEAMA